MYDVFDRALILMQQGEAAKQRQVFHVTTQGPGFVREKGQLIGERIARLRKEHRITQLAERLGVSQQTIQAYESGKRRIQVAALPELAQLLLTTLEELFG